MKKTKLDIFAEREIIKSEKMLKVLKQLQSCPENELYSRVCFISKNYYNRYKDMLEYKELKEIWNTKLK